MINTLKLIGKVAIVGTFIYVSYFSIQNFWMGLHDLDLAFNFINLGHTADMNTAGQVVSLQDVYLNGLNKVRNSFVWMVLTNIFLICSLILLKGGNNSK